mmetsp:Transcript_32287/g.72882  ORF Transcript_32287/g.72882 Transcript_32287/m.72882 type:complete len:305 (+) Transcript_32287:25-939(+)
MVLSSAALLAGLMSCAVLVGCPVAAVVPPTSLMEPLGFSDRCQRGGIRRSLREILAASGTDKYWRHGFHRYYERELAPYRDLKGVRILEIGGASPSLRAWLDYFSAPMLVQGIAFMPSPEERLSACASMEERLCSLVDLRHVDQANLTALDEFAAADPDGWDVIIDDGSHVPLHMLSSFKRLFPRLRPGGLYIIEDIETSYVDHLSEPKAWIHKGSAVERFKDLVDVVNRGHFLHADFTAFGREVDADIVRVAFGQNVVFVEKRPDEDDWHQVYPNPSWFSGKTSFETTVRRMEARLNDGEPIP